jgi:hypothetical protein
MTGNIILGVGYADCYFVEYPYAVCSGTLFTAVKSL